ncbi:hypothetical protein [Halococcus saccharolyticus]|uniref:hypothetical protein n=1 Tax=Halococcus saccharolyticus TaxID=62319 RepID=UPI0012672A59|nr:hypothetical protein [Halococcus saccharolyticus]
MTIGDRISVPVEDESGSIEITGTPTHAGIECNTAVWRRNDNARLRNYLAPKRGLVFYAAAYPPEKMDPGFKVELDSHSAVSSKSKKHSRMTY